jgi:hypothetical protein
LKISNIESYGAAFRHLRRVQDADGLDDEKRDRGNNSKTKRKPKRQPLKIMGGFVIFRKFAPQNEIALEKNETSLEKRNHPRFEG